MVGTPKRPVSITVVCWSLISVAALGVSLNLFAWDTLVVHGQVLPSILPISMQRIRMSIGAIVMMFGAIAMLRGINWARYLYIIWGGVNCIIGFATGPFISLATIPGPGLLLLTSIFLFLRNANKYFDKTCSYDHDVKKTEVHVIISDGLSEHNGTIKITRIPQTMYYMRKYVLSIDGKKVKYIGDGETISCSVPIGDHTVQARLDYMRSNILRVHIELAQSVSLQVSARELDKRLLFIALFVFSIIMIIGGAIGGVWGASIGGAIAMMLLVFFMHIASSLRVYQTSDIKEGIT